MSLHDTGEEATNAGWSDDDFDLDSPKSNGEKPKSLIPSFTAADEDDFFSVLDKKAPIRTRSIVSTKAQASKGTSLKIEKKVAVKKLPLDVSDGWDDF
jgi:hypothetical protein